MKVYKSERKAKNRIMRYLEPQEKIRSRALYEEMFTEDEKSFVDAYYAYKAPYNRILAIEEEGQMISMLHLNPYRFWVRGAHVDSSYIVAVATKPEYRHQGCMRSLIYHALHDLYQEGQPFTFLMPASEAIYLPFDFRFMKNVDAEEWTSTSMETLAEVFDLFVWKDAVYDVQHIPEVGWETTPMMVRIVHLAKLLEHVGADVEEPLHVNVRIEDEILPQNAGIYDWVIEKDGSRLCEGKKTQRPELNVSIADLGSFLFGAKSAAEVFPDAGLQVFQKLEKIHVFRNIFINEVV